MRTPFWILSSVVAMLAGECELRAEVTFDWAMIGNTGNAPDTSGFGSVAEAYKIATTEVTLSQYTEFLNAVDPTGHNALGLYNTHLGSITAILGISFSSGAASGTHYAVVGSGSRPVTYVSWNDAARFTNWLHNGQGSGSTESGVYQMSLETPVRSATATYWLPSEDEWYKAAYYDPATGNYWLYPTGSNDAPMESGPTGDSNSANYGAVMPSSNRLTDGGAYSASLSPYGTYDQGGNVWEWNDTLVEASERGLRGGSWLDDVYSLSSQDQFDADPQLASNHVGFRVASVPEPGTLGLLVLGGIALAAILRRKSVARTV